MPVVWWKVRDAVLGWLSLAYVLAVLPFAAIGLLWALAWLLGF